MSLFAKRSKKRVWTAVLLIMALLLSAVPMFAPASALEPPTSSKPLPTPSGVTSITIGRVTAGYWQDNNVSDKFIRAELSSGSTEYDLKYATVVVNLVNSGTTVSSGTPGMTFSGSGTTTRTATNVDLVNKAYNVTIGSDSYILAAGLPNGPVGIAVGDPLGVYVDFNPTKTVIIIPGIAATSLQVTHTDDGVMTTHDVWIPRTFFNPFDLEHDVNSLRCDDNGQSVENISIIDAANNGLNNPLISEYYGQLRAGLVASGYTVHYFPYDWRKDNAANAVNLASYINSLGVNKVSIVGHSMGGLVAAKYIANGNASKVDKLITLGTPYLGAPKALHLFETGEFLDGWRGFITGIPLINFDKKLKGVAPHLVSIYELLPRSEYFNYNNTYYIEKNIENLWPVSNEIIPITTYGDTRNLFSSLRDQTVDGWYHANLMQKADNFNNSVNIVNTLNSVDSYLIIGDNQPTIGKERMIFDWTHTNFLRADDVQSINGDGTVPIISANIGGRMNANRVFYITEKHSDIPSNDAVIAKVSNILQNAPHTAVAGIHSQPVNTRNLKLIIESPVELDVFDDGQSLFTRQSGTPNQSSSRNDSVDETPKNYGSLYRLGEKKIAFIKDGVYDIQLTGTGRGTMTYTLQRTDENDDLEKTVRFDDVAITPDTLISSHTDIDGTILLQIDENRDGKIDRKISPSVILDKVGSQDVTHPTQQIHVIEGISGSNGWYTSDVKLVVNAEDKESGVKNIEYKLNDSAIHDYTGEVILSEEGFTEFYSVAYNNNRIKSGAEQLSVKIDKTAPEATIFYEQDVDNPNVYTIDIKVRDTISGIDRTVLKANDNIIMPGAKVFLNQGINTIYLECIDFAGNMTIKQLEIKP